MPLGLHGMQQQVLDAHTLTAEAAANCDRSLLRRAMLVDPLTSSLADADAILKELLHAERDVLPACWYD
jgi:alpha-galactosidase